jgi:hypothetical protein
LAIVGVFAFLYLVGVATPRSAWVRALGWLLCGLGALSCSGKVFTSTEASGGAAGNGSGAFGGAGSGSWGGSGTGDAAGASGAGDAGASGNAGASGAGDAGASGAGVAGEGNSPNGVDCAALHGEEFSGHCYVDVTVESNSAPQAVAACQQLAKEHQVPGYLLVLDSDKEQTFVLNELLVSFTNKSDAWLGLTCNQLEHPDIKDCYCAGCTRAMLAEKQRAWAWLGGGSSIFGWGTGNPNDGHRCAALGYNPELTIWVWVDRACDKISYPASDGQVHGYRTICELEP